MASTLQEIGSDALTTLHAQSNALKEQLDAIARRIAAWENLLTLERDEHPVVVDGVIEREQYPQRTRFPVTDTAREIMVNAGAKGFVPKDIYRGLQERGHNPVNTIGSSIIHRLRTRGEVEMRNGRYYLTTLLPKSEELAKEVQDQQQTPP